MVRSIYSSLAAALALSVQTSYAVHGHGHGYQQGADNVQTTLVVKTVTVYEDGSAATVAPANPVAYSEPTTTKSTLPPAYTASAPSTTLQTKASTTAAAPAQSSPASYDGGSSAPSADGAAIVQRLCAASKVKNCENVMGKHAKWGIGPGSGAYTFDVRNNAGEDVALVCWSANDQQGCFDSQFVTVHSPSYVLPIKKGGSATFSIGNDITVVGSCAILSSKTSVSWYGILENSWMEYAMDPNSNPQNTDFSGVDVSTMNNAGQFNGMSITTYDKQGGTEACLSDMNVCSYNVLGGAIKPCRPNDITSVDIHQGSTQGACMFKRSAAKQGYATITISP